MKFFNSISAFLVLLAAGAVANPAVNVDEHRPHHHPNGTQPHHWRRNLFPTGAPVPGQDGPHHRNPPPVPAAYPAGTPEEGSFPLKQAHARQAQPFAA